MMWTPKPSHLADARQTDAVRSVPFSTRLLFFLKKTPRIPFYCCQSLSWWEQGLTNFSLPRLCKEAYFFFDDDRFINDFWE